MAFRRSAAALAAFRTASQSAPSRVAGRSIIRFALGVAMGAGVILLSPDLVKDFRSAHWTDRFILHADSGAKPDLGTVDESTGFRVDPETSIPFPSHLSLTTPAPNLTLVGLGVRKVSFLRVKVYSAGFYLDEKVCKQLDHVPGFQTYTAQHLLTPPPVSPVGPHMTGEALIRSLIDYPAACAVRIVPTRNTDFAHLRDGFTRAIIARQKLARKAGTLRESDDQVCLTSCNPAADPDVVYSLGQRISDALQALKAVFPSQSVPKGKALTLYRAAKGALIVEYEDKILGKVDDHWVSRELMLAYFADKDTISPKLKEDVARGFEQFVKPKTAA